MIGLYIFHKNPHGLLYQDTIYATEFEWKAPQTCMALQTDNYLSSVKPCMLCFLQTLPRVLYAGTISCVGFYGICLDLLIRLWHHFSSELGPWLMKWWQKYKHISIMAINSTEQLCTKFVTINHKGVLKSGKPIIIHNTWYKTVVIWVI